MDRSRKLESKILIPDMQKEYEQREILLSELRQEQGKLLVLHATIGYGKTVLMSQFARLPENICAWYHLDVLDNQPVTFIQYLIRSLSRVLDGFELDEEYYVEITPDGLSRFVRDLIVEIEESLESMADSRRLMLALDDFQVIDNPEIFKILEELLEHTGGYFTLMAATKGAVPDFFTKYFMRNQGVIIETERLSFREQEVSHFLGTMLPGKEAERYANMIWSNMEGWPAGVMFAALYLRRLGCFEPDVEWESITQESMVQNYIAYELYKGLPYDIQQFLLNTSFAEELQPDLCNDICGIENARGILQYLLQENLFILRIGGKSGSYRYHSMFRSFLNDRVSQEQRQEIYEKMAGYYLRHQDPDVAARYAMLSGKPEILITVLEKYGLLFLGEGKQKTVSEYLQRLEEGGVEFAPGLMKVKDALEHLGEEDGTGEKEKLLTVSCFGKFRVEIYRTGKEISWRTRKALELFACLIDREGKPVERRALLEQLWPDNAPNNSVAMLHNMIYSIRKELSSQPELAGLIQYRNHQYYLDTSQMVIDLESKKEICRLAETADAEALYARREELLTPWGVYLAEVDGTWCMARRVYFERGYGKACSLLADFCRKQGDYETEEACWTAYVASDRYSEDAVAGLLQCYVRSGDRKQIKRVFESAQKIFREELDVDLSAETVRIYEQAMKKKA